MECSATDQRGLRVGDRAARTRRVACNALLLTCASPALLTRAAPARADEIPWSVRAAAGVAMMTTAYQREELDYDRIGIVGDIQLAYRFLPWLDAKAGMAGGGFLASQSHTDGRPADWLRLRSACWRSLTHHELHPYAQLDIGAAFTGALIKPFFRAGVGLDFELTRAFALGPTLGYGQVFQTDAPGFGSPDARYMWIGIGVSYRPTRSVPVPRARSRRARAPPPPALEPAARRSSRRRT